MPDDKHPIAYLSGTLTQWHFKILPYDKARVDEPDFKIPVRRLSYIVNRRYETQEKKAPE